jgi:hypothetical protein
MNNLIDKLNNSEISKFQYFEVLANKFIPRKHTTRLI